MVDDIKEILRLAARKSESVPLHALLWTIDAKHHAIPTVEELNAALQNAGDFRVERTAEEVSLVPFAGAGPAEVAQNDIAVAMTLYESIVKKVLGRKRKQSTSPSSQRRDSRG